MVKHGGDIYKNQVSIDFSANINPFGMPESVKLAAIEGIEQSIHYPDVECEKLIEAIALKEKVAKEHIICANGAADLIFQFVNGIKPKRAILVKPSFLEYEQALKAVGCEISSFILSKENQFRLQETFLECLTQDISIVFLCNPNNPTGEIISFRFLKEVIVKCKNNDIIIVIDECFLDFIKEKEQMTAVFLIEECPNLFILKAFTKMYGMAGLRLGYGITTNQRILESIKENRQPWSVSIPAQLAGVAACGEAEFVDRTIQYIVEEREYLIKEMRKLGFTIYGSKANYIFFQGRSGLYEDCLAQGILIRSCSNYEGLDETYYRIAIKRHEDNVKLLNLLRSM